MTLSPSPSLFSLTPPNQVEGPAEGALLQKCLPFLGQDGQRVAGASGQGGFAMEM